MKQWPIFLMLGLFVLVLSSFDSAEGASPVSITIDKSSGDILDHFVSINADSYLPVDDNLIPTGEIKNVKSTPFDFREMKKIGLEIEIQNNQLIIGKGYDHCWVLNDYGEGIRKIAEARSLNTGINMEVYSDQPGVQFYTGNFLDGSPVSYTHLTLPTSDLV